ncbi:MAG TPA: glycosidase [Deltaproteobacteria bacterium]|nr:glycosidase [Deltaproteobacteria bacterium]HPP81330.1 glycosidase [Deltaproteobacteria bacterium]
MEVFTRYEGNPILTVKDIPYPANSVFNAAACVFGSQTLLLMRVEDKRGISHLTVATSDDGVTGWRVEPGPALEPDPVKHPEEIWGIEDPRITRIDDLDLWAVLFTAYSRGGPLVSLATTRDFRVFERKGVVMPPEDKDAALFPVRFGGRWAMVHRPASSVEHTGAHIWISFSPDMKHWGDHQVLLPARKGAWWDANKIGLSPPPMETDKGWLVLYHGVRATASGCIYRLGLALLDRQDPTRVLMRSDEWVFGPQEDYEVVGDVDKVVFPCGWVRHGDEVRLYYGAADRCIGLAFTTVGKLLSWLEEHHDRDRRAWP